MNQLHVHSNDDVQEDITDIEARSDEGIVLSSDICYSPSVIVGLYDLDSAIHQAKAGGQSQGEVYV